MKPARKGKYTQEPDWRNRIYFVKLARNSHAQSRSRTKANTFGWFKPLTAGRRKRRPPDRNRAGVK